MRLQSAGFGGRRVSCIMYGGCYFHHMVLLGVIVVPALSAQIAVCLQIVVVSLLTLSPSYSPCYSSCCTLFGSVMEMEVKDPLGSINWSCLQSGVEPGLRGGTLSRAGCCDKAGPCCQATQENAREKVALLWSACIISHRK